MWKKIDNKEIVAKITIDDVITENPGDSSDQFIIRRKGTGYISAVHINGKIDIRVFPEKELLSGRWWVKE